MTNVLLHPVSQHAVTQFVQHPMHGLLLTGPKGVGLKTIAKHIATRLDDASVIQLVEPDEKNMITIESIRKLYTLTRTGRDSALVIIIDDAESMGREAQNALLKLLEEPNKHVYFMLTSHRPQLLLATIISRVQSINILPLASEQSSTLINADIDPALKAQIAFLGSGLPAEITRIQSDESYQARAIKVMRDARQYMQGDAYERLRFASEYAGDRVMAIHFLEALSMLLMYMAYEKQQIETVSQLADVERVSERIRQNAHIKTQLAYLATLFSRSLRSATM